MNSKWMVCISWLVLTLILTCVFTPLSTSQTDRDSRSFYMGFTNFPSDISIEAVVETNSFIQKHGDIISHHIEQGIPWPEALNDEPFHSNVVKDWDDRKKLSKNKKVFLSLNPINNGRDGIALYRGKDENMPLPKAFTDLKLNDQKIKTAYYNFCRRAVDHFQPDYLAIGIEVNELIHNRREMWEPFVELYHHVYKRLKKNHPQLPIFATFSLHNLTNPGWNDREFQQQEIKKFIQSCDLVGISYYPFMASQSEKPVKQFEWLRQFTDKTIAFTETGFLAETLKIPSYNLTIKGNEAMQKTYFKTLFKYAQRDHYLFIINFLAKDYDRLWDKIKDFAPEAFKVWKDCGMLDEQSNPRPVLKVWDHYLKLPKSHLSISSRIQNSQLLSLLFKFLFHPQRLVNQHQFFTDADRGGIKIDTMTIDC